MRKATIMVAFLLSLGMLQAQENIPPIKKGTVLTLGTPTATGFQFINFPRKNTIIKRGAIANFTYLEGRKVMVEEVRSENGITQVILKRKDGLNFFRFWPNVMADYEKALIKGELLLPKSKKEESKAKP